MEKTEWALHPGLPRRDEDRMTLQGGVVRKVFEPGAARHAPRSVVNW
jgi:hypothetical protein